MSVDFANMSDEELRFLIADAQAEQHRRGLERNDLDALIEEGFSLGFLSSGMAKEPYMRGTILVCPGSVVEKSAMSHDCAFAHIGEDWVWESPHLLLDSVRKVPERSRMHQRSISLVAAVEGLEFDMVVSKMRQSVHAMASVRSYKISNGELELVSARAVQQAARH